MTALAPGEAAAEAQQAEGQETPSDHWASSLVLCIHLPTPNRLLTRSQYPSYCGKTGHKMRVQARSLAVKGRGSQREKETLGDGAPLSQKCPCCLLRILLAVNVRNLKWLLNSFLQNLP